jgi:6,7-dimethyl-8-ribityllumazine synthase
MSTELPVRPASPSAVTPPSTYALVVSRYNPRFTTALADHARAELIAIEPDARVETFEAPGSFEIPLLVQLLAAKQKYAAILALGVIIEGETAHAQLIAASITNALQTTAITHGIPVIHEVLLVGSAEQAEARCLGPDLNRGTEAARTAVTAARAIRAILAT